MVHGRRVDIGLGNAELVRLADAPRAAADNRALARPAAIPGRQERFRSRRRAPRDGGEGGDLAARQAEVRRATRDEFDFEAAV